MQKPRQEEVQGRHGFGCVYAAAAAAKCGGHHEQSGKYCFHKLALKCSGPVRPVSFPTDGAAVSMTVNPGQPPRMREKHHVFVRRPGKVVDPTALTKFLKRK